MFVPLRVPGVGSSGPMHAPGTVAQGYSRLVWAPARGEFGPHFVTWLDAPGLGFRHLVGTMPSGARTPRKRCRRAIKCPTVHQVIAESSGRNGCVSRRDAVVRNGCPHSWVGACVRWWG